MLVGQLAVDVKNRISFGRKTGSILHNCNERKLQNQSQGKDCKIR